MSTRRQGNGSTRGLLVGDPVEVWSDTNDSWVAGAVDGVMAAQQRVHVTYACGLMALRKELPVSSPLLRVLDGPATRRPTLAAVEYNINVKQPRITDGQDEIDPGCYEVQQCDSLIRSETFTTNHWMDGNYNSIRVHSSTVTLEVT